MEWKGFIPTVTTLATAIAGFKLAKTAIEIAKVTKAMTLLRVAKIKDKAETLYLNALYAKDAIVKAASTAATWAQTAATTAWNVVCTAATRRVDLRKVLRIERCGLQCGGRLQR